ncbi:unnamed protein product [Boreogadus saida]
MAYLAVGLLLQTGLVLATNYGYVEWSDSEKDAELRTKKPTVLSSPNSREPLHAPTLLPPAENTQRTLVAHKIEEDLPRVVTAFLHSGDPAALRAISPGLT